MLMQVITLDGKFIEEAKWEVDNPALISIGDDIQISLLTKDKELLAWVTTNSPKGCLIEHDEEVSLILSFRITRFRHMFEPITKTISSMAILIPTNRSVESVILYNLSSKLCDPRFLALIKKQ